MDTQSLTQTINILVGGDGLANTGTSIIPPLVIGLVLLISASLIYVISRRSHKLNFRVWSIFLLLAIFGTSLSFNLSHVSAAPTLSLGANQNELTVTVPEGGGTASTTTTLTTSTTNPTGYTLTASLTEPEPGIAIKLKGGNVTNSIALNAGDSPLTLKTTNSASSNDTTEVILDFTIDGSVTPGKKNLKLSYAITDNNDEGGEEGPTTMQTFTPSDCNNLDIYDGTNEEAILTLNDPRGEGQDYRIAKLADNQCWMLDNLKLGSTEDTLTLTPSDSNVASNFTLPQVTTTGTPDYDNPGVYGPVPGDTGANATNYGYLYNWSAATAGESRTSHDETSGNAPYSVCPANWRLPTIDFDVVPSDEFSLRVSTDGNYSTGGTWSIEITAPITATVGPFAYDVDGDTVAAALGAAVGETVTTNNSGIVEQSSQTDFSWDSLDDTWEIALDLTDLEQENGPGLYDAQVISGDPDYNVYGDFPDLDRAFGGNGMYSGNSEPNIAKWQLNGPFKGVFAGYWGEVFGGQGGYGVWWSSSAYPGYADFAHVAYLVAAGVYPAYGIDRAYGIGVRCLLQ